MSVTEEIKDILRYERKLAEQNIRKEDLQWKGISYVNWWVDAPEHIWFSRFIEYYFPDRKKQIRFYGLFGPERKLHDHFRGVKIFFTGENLEPHQNFSGQKLKRSSVYFWEHRLKRYGDYDLDQADLSMGFGYKQAGNYFRFPLWILFHFQPEDDLARIRERCDAINAARVNENAKGIVLLASHDDFGMRTAICDELGNVFPITYGGRWRNNSNELKTKYNDDKYAYIKNFRFNICPENTDAPGYCTEKLFDAFSVGTVPIYHGALNDPEPGIINRNAVIFWNGNGDNNENMELIRRLSNDDNYYRLFTKQEKLTAAAPEYVYGCMQELKNRISVMLQE